MNISKDDIQEYLATGGKVIGDFAVRVYGNSINPVGEGAFSDAVEIGISNTIASLYDVNIEDGEIVRGLNKYWGINSEEAEERLLFEKSQLVIRELRHYLKLQGYSSDESTEFIKNNKESVKIRHDKELGKLRDKPERLMKAVQDKK